MLQIVKKRGLDFLFFFVHIDHEREFTVVHVMNPSICLLLPYCILDDLTPCKDIDVTQAYLLVKYDYMQLLSNKTNDRNVWKCYGCLIFLEQYADVVCKQHKEKYMANKIKRQWKISISCPEYKICQSRLLFEFNEFLTGA